MSIRAESSIKFSTYYDEIPHSAIIRNLHDRISVAIMDICEELDIKRSHIQVQCPVGYQFAFFYGMEDDEAYSLDLDHDDGEEEDDS